MRLYLIERPRTFIVTTNSHALIIRHPSPTYKHYTLKGLVTGYGKSKDANNKDNNVLVEFVLKDYLDLSSYRDITPKNNKRLLGLLGLLNVKGKIFIGFITRDELVASATIDDKIYKITNTDFYCLNNDEYDYLLEREYESLSHQERERLRYPAASVQRLLSSGGFYYSKTFDMSSNIQERGNNSGEFKLIADSDYFKRFMWNGFMSEELIESRNRMSVSEQKIIDKSGLLVIVTRGYAKTVNTTIGKDEALLTLISKQSCAKEGPLFGDWGSDGNGFVSNYLESEIIIYTKKFCLSYIIVRGNVPMYWELTNNFTTKNILAPNGRQLVFPRSFEASQESFVRHLDRLAAQYGDIHILNALSDKSYKGVLNDAFEEQISYYLKHKESEDSGFKVLYNHVPITASRVKKIGYSGQNPYDIVSVFADSIVSFGALFYDSSSTSFIGKQLGVFRINSFDSLSKANFLSKVISQEVIQLAFRDIGIELDRDIFLKHARLWEENDICISKLTLNYVSTRDKLHKSNTTIKSALVKSNITKKYFGGVVESKPNEIAMLKLLGRMQDQSPVTIFNPLHNYVSKELNKHAKEFTSRTDLCVFTSTFNVNAEVYDGDITKWIYPNDVQGGYDLILIGLQEIVELNAGQMVNTDFRNKTQWERKILSVLLKHDKYMVMWSGQLGGVALFFFVKESQVKYVSNVECSFKKTGLGGVSANKGAIAVSFKFSDTAMCFVSSHFAAGLANTEERHHNYKSLTKGIQFSKNRRIQNHDAIIWLGDFNYRIDLTNEQVKPMILQKMYGKIFEFDQLNQQMASGESFPFFAEQEINFPPTYKFDKGTKVYDTSEKQRIPAWTDRILFLSIQNLIQPLKYNSCQDIIFSDHRPVYATFTITVKIVNQTIKKNLSNEIYETYKDSRSGIYDILVKAYTDKDLNDENSGLPPPSSDKQKWWLEGGKPAKVSIAALNDEENGGPTGGSDLVMNPWRPINPFERTNEPEFVSKKELEALQN
ncbi:Phosphatidylinositol 4,5-bisphosphate 5-phosphatase INP51 [Candida viswanathii]|uniref:phosphoinositide 5-phosphatase n=1 Tax=Candida viswanathii TaxID=5486 RepID=A0A367XNY0_9ASCO|nr:Phosphatidylinositol 4,5-bisphosphate 5-phosphatase INP51 [Candida viswanathii]